MDGFCIGCGRETVSRAWLSTYFHDSLYSPFRLAIQYHVRRIKKDVRDADFKTIEKLRTTLLTLLNKLSRLQLTAGVPFILAAGELSHFPRAPRGVTTRSQSAAQQSAPLPPPGPRNEGLTTAEEPADDVQPADGEVINVAPAMVAPAGITEPNGARSNAPPPNGPRTQVRAAQSRPVPPAQANNIPAAAASGPNVAFRQEDLVYWDSLVDMADAVLADQSAADSTGDVPPEKMKLALPSNMSVPAAHCGLELTFRKRKAKALLHQIRELIAEKSFKYTDEIRKAPRKGVRTRGQTAVLELNRRLSLLCQIYAWNRARMIDLQADEATLAGYQVLKKEDIKCSTAVLQPNKAGSTKLKLSWIWHSVDRRVMAGLGTPPTNDPATLDECTSVVHRSFSSADMMQSGEYTGFVPVQRLKGGVKKPSWSAMRCNGQSPTTNTKAKYGPPL